MATADVTLTQFQTEVGQVKTSMEAEDFASARKYLALARVTYAGLPKSLATGDRVATLREELDAAQRAIDEYERAAAGAGNVQIGLIAFGRPA